jgi:hypothetical protein
MLSPSTKLRINSAKHLGFSRFFEDEILRLRLRMILRDNLTEESGTGNGAAPELDHSARELEPTASLVLPPASEQSGGC